MQLTLTYVVALLAASPYGCDRTEPVAVASRHHEHDDMASVPTNRIATPPGVRQNLGITFVRVEKRPVRSTVRLPGQFEFRPIARREYHVMLSGRIDLAIAQYERVEAGQPLFHLLSPEWQGIKSELLEVRNAMRRSHADLAVSEARVTETEQSAAFIANRLEKLAEANMRQVELESELADKRNMLPRLRAELEAARTEFDAIHARYDVLLSRAAALTGIAKDDLDPHSDHHGHLEDRHAPWRHIDRITIRAEAEGVVNQLAVTNQGWANTGDLVMDTIDPTALRFHGDALQTDLKLFSDGQRCRIVPPQGGSIDLQDTADGTIEVGFQADSSQRTIPIFVVPKQLPSWAKAGVTAFLEVYTAGTDHEVLAIPESSIVRDGLESVYFRRDPSDPNAVIRTVADLGVSDGRWVELRSGVMLGDDVVLVGVYPLMLATTQSGALMKGGHFHADGTFHAKDH